MQGRDGLILLRSAEGASGLPWCLHIPRHTFYRYTSSIGTLRSRRSVMAVSIPAPLVRRRDRRFYSGMALVITAIVFAGFYRTFYLSPWLQGPALSPLRILHGAAFSAWILLFVAQTTLVAAGRTDIHRRLGVAGAVL